MKYKPDLGISRRSASDAKAAQIRAFRLAFVAAQPSREAKLKELLATAVRQKEALAAAEAETASQQAALEAKQAMELRAKEEAAHLAAQEAAKAKAAADLLATARAEALRLDRAASEVRRVNSLSDEGVRKAQRARRIAARS